MSAVDPEARTTFALGPTNTGKTHRAIQRMLDFDSGMIGLPLRLLAREVYDKVTAQVGEERVALVTGEEKRVPRSPAYWVCTVEAMPLSRPVEFIAVDEIQLCAHIQRGHIFTERLLHARGTKETWFLGSDTMRPITQRLFPAARQRNFQRYSTLRFTGSGSLRGIPRRGCAVAFSAEQVYEIAERLRALRGGVAVVLGALSPRTRNAQVAMYQAGEVSHLVATDAIGMGLNLDIDHVSFAGLRKFDGRTHRPLTAAELGQIAGRAGRHLNDGTFGTLRNSTGRNATDRSSTGGVTSALELPDSVALAIETHRFRAVERLVWRNHVLCFDSTDALLRSLSEQPDDLALRRVEYADDFEALSVLSRDPDVQRLATDPEALKMLWETCQLPDFRKLMLSQHAKLVKGIFLMRHNSGGAVDDAWLEGKLLSVQSLSGDLDALTARLKAVRVLTYVSHQSGWVRDAAGWREQTRSVEDNLGDALHERLTERFVADRQTKRTRRRKSSESSAPTGPFAELGKLSLGDATRGVGPITVEGFVERIHAGEHVDFALAANAVIWFEGEAIARLVRGRTPGAPTAALVNPGEFRAGERKRIDQRLRALSRDFVLQAAGGVRCAGADEKESGPGAAAQKEMGRTEPAQTAALRALAYTLREHSFLVPLKTAAPLLGELTHGSRRLVLGWGLKEGSLFLFSPAALTLSALETRATLTSLYRGEARPRGVPVESWVPIRRFDSDGHALRYGYVRQGHIALRADVLERIYSESGGEETSPTLLALSLSENRTHALERRARRVHRPSQALGER